MTRFDSRIGAGILVALGAGVLVGSVASGHSARSEAPIDVRPAAADTGVDALGLAGALASLPGAAIVDVRPAADFARYHVPGSTNEPGAAAVRVAELARQHPAVIVVAGGDEAGEALAKAARGEAADRRIHYLKDGARGFYLAFELPVPLFSDREPPYGYEEALGVVRSYLADRKPETAAAAADAVARLTRLAYQPTMLKGRTTAKAGGAKKKIAGGCG